MNSISIRDDDINFFTDANRLRRIYEPLFDFIKPTLCITPNAGRIYWEVRKRENELLSTSAKRAFVKIYQAAHPCSINETNSIWENQELVSLIKNWTMAGRVDLALHGITHDPTVFGYECDSTVPDIDRLQKAIGEMEENFHVRVQVFSPPNNSIGRQWFNAVSKIGLNIVHSAGPKPWEVPVSLSALTSCARIVLNRLRHGRAGRVHHIMSFGKIKLVPSIPTLPFSELDNIHAVIDEIANSDFDNTLVIATHSYAFEYDPNMYDRLTAVVRHAYENGFIPMGLSEILGDKR